MKKSIFSISLGLLHVIVLLALMQPLNGQVVLLTENWETAAIGQTPPADWNVELVYGSNYTHFLYSGTIPTCIPINGNRMVEFKSSTAAVGTKNRLARTNPVQTTGYTFISIDFQWYTNNNYPTTNDRVEIQWSLNGTTWSTASTIQRYSATNGWQYKEVALPAGAANQPAVYIAFLFSSGHGHNCHLDLVHMNGFTVPPPPPTVATLAPAWIGAWNAYLSGSVNPNGFVTTAYFQYGLTTSYGSVTEAVTVTGTTATSISGYPNLMPSHLYHCRAVGTNLGGTTYGNDITFTTSDTLPEVLTHYADNITQTSATVNGTVYPNGSTTTVTFDYGLTSAYGNTVAAIPPTVSGDSIHAWAIANLSGLTANTTYHYRINGVNAGGTAHGIDTVFTTNGTMLPTVITTSATSVTTTGATLNGNVNANGTPTTVTFQYGLTPAYGSTVTYGTVSGNTMTLVSKNLTGLLPGTPYHFRAIGVNANGTTYGQDTLFTTFAGSQIPPTVITTGASYFSASNAVLHGSINPNGSFTTVSFQYGLTPAYGSTLPCGTIFGNNLAPVSMQANDLNPATVYHYRAVGVNSGGTTFGNDTTFMTYDSIPSLLTKAATNIGASTATLNGLINPYGSTATVGFEYGLTSGYGNAVSAIPATVTGNTNHDVFVNISGLDPGTMYHFRIKGSNAMGQAFGSDSTFTTADSLPGHQLFGQVFAGDTPIQSGMVNLMALDTVPPFQPYGDSSLIDSTGNYHFNGVPDGDFYILAVPDGVTGFLPTYFGDAIYWEDATLVHLGTPANPYPINLATAGSPYFGNGSIHGTVYLPAPAASYADKINMLLMNASGYAVSYDFADPGGKFSFSSLAFGTYYLYAELAGTESELIKVVLAYNNHEVAVNILFSDNKFTGITKEPSEIKSFLVFPVPVNDVINLSISAGKRLQATAEISTMTGMVVLQSGFEFITGENHFTIHATDLPNGIYNLSLRFSNGERVTRKVTVLR